MGILKWIWGFDLVDCSSFSGFGSSIRRRSSSTDTQTLRILFSSLFSAKPDSEKIKVDNLKHSWFETATADDMNHLASAAATSDAALSTSLSSGRKSESSISILFYLITITRLTIFDTLNIRKYFKPSEKYSCT